MNSAIPTTQTNQLTWPELAALVGLAALIYLPPEIFSAAGILLLLALTTTKNRITIARIFYPTLVMLSTSLVMTFVSIEKVDFVQMARSSSYIIFPIISFSVGYILSKYVRSQDKLLLLIVMLSMIDSLSYILTYLNDPLVASATRSYIRSEIGVGSILSWLCPLAVFLLLSSKATLFRILLGMVGTGLSIYSIYLSTSRLGLATLVISIVVAVTYRYLGLYFRKAIALIIVLSLLFATPLVAWIVGVPWLTSELPGPFAELVPPTYVNLQSINMQWRGYETSTAFAAVANDGPLALFLGKGLSYLVPLGISIDLGGELFQEIGLFHNAFAFAFVRAGLLGVALYVLQLTMLANITLDMYRKVGKIYYAWIVLAVTCIIFLAYGSPTITGLFNWGSSGRFGLIVTGFLFYRYVQISVDQIGDTNASPKHASYSVP